MNWWRRGDAEYEAAQRTILSNDDLDVNEKFQLQHDAAIRAFQNNVLGALLKRLAIFFVLLALLLCVTKVF